MEMSKSEEIWDIVSLIRLKVITYDDLSDLFWHKKLVCNDKKQDI